MRSPNEKGGALVLAMLILLLVGTASAHMLTRFQGLRASAEVERKSLDAFYARNATIDERGNFGSMSVGGYWPSHLEARIRDMQQARVLNCEMESGIILTLAGLFGVRAGCVCVVSDRTPWPGPAEIDLDRNMGACIDVASRAMLEVAG